MKLYEVRVRDTLVLRDNRPMATGAGRAATMEMPWPSTTAGLARTRLATNARGEFSASEREIEALRAVEVLGPWLLEDGSRRVFFPAPRDILWFHDEANGRVARRLVPIPREDDMLDGHDGESKLALVGFEPGTATPLKPIPGPRYWSWDAIHRWAQGGSAPDPLGPEVLTGLPEEERTHVALKETRVHEDGQLFATMQRRYVSADGDAMRVFSIGFGVGDDRDLAPGLVAFGGERRVATLARTEGSLPPFDASRFKDARRLKVLLLTPGIFTEGAVPTKFATPDGDPSVVAAIVARPEVVSGWDFERRRPKPTRRVVSSGAIYWIDVTGLDAAKVARHLWFRPVSSSTRDRADGYGLAVAFPDTNSQLVTG